MNAVTPFEVANAASVLHARPDGDVTQAGCVECRAPVPARPKRALFCCAEHRIAWHNRQTVRGRVLTALVMAARQTRNGTRGDTATGKRATADANVLMQDWRDEDLREGRLSAVEYMERRYALGFDPW